MGVDLMKPEPAIEVEAITAAHFGVIFGTFGSLYSEVASLNQNP